MKELKSGEKWPVSLIKEENLFLHNNQLNVLLTENRQRVNPKLRNINMKSSPSCNNHLLLWQNRVNDRFERWELATNLILNTALHGILHLGGGGNIFFSGESDNEGLRVNFMCWYITCYLTS